MLPCDECPKSIMLRATLSRRVEACVISVVFFCILALLVSFLLPVYRGLVCLFWMVILCNTLIPVAPHEPVVLLYGKLYSPCLVAICAGIAILVIEPINYSVLASILSSKKIRTFREKRFYQRAEHYFSKFPFLSLLFACLAPVPFIPFRILAVTTKYSVKKFALSAFLGRTVRFYVLALVGDTLNLPVWVYVIAVVTAFSIVLTKKLAGRRKGSDKEALSNQE